jgi:branched-chain amino acid transport system permease protein
MKALRTFFFGSPERITVWAIIILLLVGAALVNAFAPFVYVGIYTYFCVTLMLVLGLQMFMGNSGILNWTYVGFVGIGAYAASILSTAPMVKQMGVPNMYPALVKLQMPVLPAVLMGGLVAAAIAAIIAWPLMRLSDAAGVITLFATLIVIHVILTQWDNVTNGPRTFFGVQQFTTIWIGAVAACVTLVVAHLFRESSLGLRVRATRDDRYAARAVGVNMVAVRYVTFVLSSFIAGFGGGLWAHYITSFSPKSFYVGEAFVLLSMLIIGGAGSVTGATVGAVVITVLREALRQLEGYLNNAQVFSFEVYGLTEVGVAMLLIIMLVWRPSGIVGGSELVLPWVRRRRSDGAASTSSGPEETAHAVPETSDEQPSG